MLNLGESRAEGGADLLYELRTAGEMRCDGMGRQAGRYNAPREHTVRPLDAPIEITEAATYVVAQWRAFNRERAGTKARCDEGELSPCFLGMSDWVRETDLAHHQVIRNMSNPPPRTRARTLSCEHYALTSMCVTVAIAPFPPFLVHRAIGTVRSILDDLAGTRSGHNVPEMNVRPCLHPESCRSYT